MVRACRPGYRCKRSAIPRRVEDATTERIMDRINLKEVSKFLSGAAFAGSLANFYLYWQNIPVPFLGSTISPRLLGLRAVVQFILFVVFLYYGYLKK
jgi:hypothetical protein